MDWLEAKSSLASFLKKYQWAAVVILAGLILMALPDGAAESLPEPEAAETGHPEQTLQQELEEILSQLEGAGKVRVLLTVSQGGQTYYQSDTDLSGTDTSREERRETVILSGTDRSETGLVQREDPPSYLGAVVLCQGADRPTVKLAVVDAVATATGLGSNHISVWKMK